jgi:hypothetical protein
MQNLYIASERYQEAAVRFARDGTVSFLRSYRWPHLVSA